MTALSFDILGRDKASAAFDKVSKAADRTEKKFGFLAARSHGLTAGMTAGFGKVVAAMGAVATVQVFKGFIDEARESRKVAALTESIIKSTGGAAKISATQVGDLATAISNKTGADDEAIQTGANLLLTFKNVRNEVGKGANIFDRATQAAVDLSAAGFGDINGASKMLGKALNDPLKGITALGRAGVTFTDQQKKQIKTLVETGKTLEAQKIILREVESQVGGAAAASADPMQKLGVILGNVKETVGTAFLPIIDKAAVILGRVVPAAVGKAGLGLRALGAAFREGDVTSDGFVGVMERIGVTARQAFDIFKTSVLPRLKEFGGFLTKSVIPALGKTAQFIGKNKDFFIPFAATIVAIVAALKAWAAVQAALNVILAANPVGLVVIAIAALVAGVIYAYKHSEKFRNIVDTLGGALKKAFFAVVGFAKDTIKFFKELPGNVKNAVGDTAKLLVQKGKDFFQGLVNGIWSIAKGIDAWMMRAPVAKLLAPWYGAIKWLVGPGKNFITGFLNGIVNIAKRIGGWLNRNVISPVVTAFSRAGSWLFQHGKNFITGLINGVMAYLRAIKGIGSWLYTNVIVPAVRPFAQSISWLARAGRDLIGGLIGGIATRMKGISSWIKSNVVDPMVSAVKKFFGIRSPSKVFEGIGGHLIGGLLKGMGSGMGSAVAKKVFGDMPSALRALVGKGLVSLTNLPKKALDALSGGPGISLPSDIGLGAGANRKVVYSGEVLDWSTYQKVKRAERLLGGALNITQGSYERASSYSGTTHTGGGVFDVVGGNLQKINAALRSLGFASWIRNPGQGPWPWHIHALEIGNAKLSGSARGQVMDFLAGGDGLGGYRKGTPWVPNDQVAFLHKGEAVVPSEVNKRAHRMPMPTNGGGTLKLVVVAGDSSPYTAFLVRELRKYVRVEAGGDVQQALGVGQ